MCSKNINIFANNKIHPKKPLILINFTGLCENGMIKHILKLCGPQDIQFCNTQYLIDNSLTLVIPKHIIGCDNKMYTLNLLDSVNSALVIQNSNGVDLDFTIIEYMARCEYYITISITSDLFVDCDLILRFVKFDIMLDESDTVDCDCCKNKSCKNQWQWIASTQICCPVFPSTTMPCHPAPDTTAPETTAPHTTVPCHTVPCTTGSCYNVPYYTLPYPAARSTP
jgi:hypothetical protein